MKNLSRVLKATFYVLLLVGCSAFVKANPIGPQQAKYSFENTHGIDLAGLVVEANHMQRAEILPLPFSSNTSSFFSMRFHRNHFVLLSILVSLALFVLAHKNHFETDIYEFYHRDQEGIVTFESVEAQRAHFLRAAWAKIFRMGGIICAAASVTSFFVA